MAKSAWGDPLGDLSSLFLSASEAAARRIREAGWPLTAPTLADSVERNRKKLNNWLTSKHEVHQNILAHPNTPLYKFAPLLSPDVIDFARRCASNIFDMPASEIPFWSPFPGNGWLLTANDLGEQSTDGADWTANHLLLSALLAHLKALPSLDATTPEAAHTFAAETLQVATAKNLLYQVTIPLAGIDIKAKSGIASVSDEVSIRRLSAEEQGSFLADWGSSLLAGGGFGALPHTTLELRISGPRMEQYPDIREKVSKWLCALQLHGYSLAGSTAKIEATPAWVMPSTSHDPITVSRQPRKWSEMNTVHLQKVCATVEHLQSYNVSEPRSTHDLALHRFCSGAARHTGADAVLDFVIALESLLLPYDEKTRHGDLAYRFRIHGAHYLSKVRKERNGTAKQLADLYEIRSRLVHGGKYPAKGDIEAARNTAEELARRGLLRAVTGGFPTPSTFKDMVLRP